MRWTGFWLLMGWALIAQAHDYWLVEQGDGLALHRGHRFSDHAGKAELPFPRQQIVGAWCLREGRIEPVKPLNDHYPYRFTGRCDVLSVKVDSGIWTQTLTGIVHKPASEVMVPLKSWRAVETITYVRPGYFHRNPIQDAGLALVFRQDPRHSGPGDKVRLRAMLRGKPVKGALVAYEGQTRGDTDEQGRINLRIRHAGLQTIAASYKDYSHPHPHTKYTLYATTLLFTVGDR